MFFEKKSAKKDADRAKKRQQQPNQKPNPQKQKKKTRDKTPPKETQRGFGVGGTPANQGQVGQRNTTRSDPRN